MAWTAEQYEQGLAPYALKSLERKNHLGKGFRKGKTGKLKYRTEYHRDRDRILWSKAFKRLQHKTQIFPHYVEDHYKRRLTHSLEVAQIATTVARVLGLNEIATEAMAFGHDLGHAPFGHDGEKALNDILKSKQNGEKDKDAERYSIPIFEFDHCMHGIEVVSRIEKEYKHEKGGLNLTFDVRDGILKHMYDGCGKCKADEGRIKIPDVVEKFSEYKKYGNNKGSLEAQCVYFADKICYLFGDIEDGIRSDILQCEKLSEDDFWKFVRKDYKRWRPDDKISKLKKKSELVSFRNKSLTSLITNCIESAQKKIKAENFKNVDEVLEKKERMIFVSDDLESLWSNFYNEWMRENLFKHVKVKACGFKARGIVRDLFEAYSEMPELMNERYVKHCKKAYASIFKDSDKKLDLVIVTNYIAGMTDVFATNQHARLFMSSERVSF